MFNLWDWRKRVGQAGETSVPAAVTYGSGEIGDINQTTVEVTFTGNVNSPGLGYDAGVTIRVNAIAATILTATRQDPSNDLVHYVLSAAVDIDDVITFEYDDDFGDLEDDDTNPLADIASSPVTNYVGSHYYFDTEESSAWVAASVG